LSGGELTGSGNVAVAGVLNWTGGKMSGPGHTLANGTVTISGNTEKKLDGRTFDNAGTATWMGSGDLSAGNGAVWNNLASATFDLQTDKSFQFSLGGIPAVLHNAGTIRRLVNSATTTLGIDLINTGLVEVQNGTLAL